LIASIHGAISVAVLDGSGSIQMTLDHGASATIVRKDEHPIVTEAEGKLLETQYLPQKFRHRDDVMDKYRSQLAELSAGLSDDILKHLPNSTSCLVFDIGANVGTFTDEVIAKRPDCRVIAFEPIEEVFSYFVDKHKNNINIIAEPLAVSDKSGPKIFYQDAAFSTAFAGSSLEKISPDQKPQKVTATTLTDYFHSWHPDMGDPQVHAIRIDVSGGEWRVLHGMHELLETRKNLPIIMVKTGTGKAGTKQAKQEVEEMEWLFTHGYKRSDDTLSGPRELVLMPTVPFTVPAAVSRTLPKFPWVVIRVWCIVIGLAVLLMYGVWKLKSQKMQLQSAAS